MEPIMGLLDKLKRKERKKAVVVGLDGVPFTLLEDLRKRGRIPHMSSLFGTGYFGQMSVSIPEISSVSWTSFMTGKQSGEHGIFGFIDLEPGTYSMRFPNYLDNKASTLWDELALKGKKTVVINMPATYPAREINGALISGFVAIDINKAVHPSTLIPKLKRLKYRIDLDTVKARHDHEFLFRDLDFTLDSRQHVVDLLWQEVDWDLFIIVITGTDRLMHFLWSAHENKNHRFHQKFIDYFQKLDEFVGRLYERFSQLEGIAEEDKSFFMLSDHGFTRIESEVYLNRWLCENGYLNYQKDNPETIMDIGSGSTAFVIDPSRVYINVIGKFPYGHVDPKDYDRIRMEIKDGLEKLTFNNGQPVVKRVYLKEDIYHGPFTVNAPDFVILSNSGFDLKGSVTSERVFDRTNLEGMHTQDDAFFFNTTGIECKSIFEIKQVIVDSLVS
jgi:predicted AlkP superfamily phosphohydrolase/phosphomutase